jgi:hypothetical protein
MIEARSRKRGGGQRAILNMGRNDAELTSLSDLITEAIDRSPLGCLRKGHHDAEWGIGRDGREVGCERSKRVSEVRGRGEFGCSGLFSNWGAEAVAFRPVEGSNNRRATLEIEYCVQ